MVRIFSSGDAGESVASLALDGDNKFDEVKEFHFAVSKTKGGKDRILIKKFKITD